MADTQRKSGENPRTVVVRLVTDQIREESFPDRSLEQIKESHSFIMERVYGVMRWRRALRWMLKQMVQRKPAAPVEAALMAGLYELLFMRDPAEHAVIDELVKTTRQLGHDGAAHFVNAILRRCQREKETLLQDLAKQPLGIRTSHPDILIHRWTRCFGSERTEALCEWNNERAEVALHPNTLRATSTEYGEQMQALGMELRPHPAAPDAFFVVPRGTRIVEMYGFDTGLFSIQDPATRLAVDLLAPQAGEYILDACAAPGGKSMLIAERMNGGHCLVAMDLHEDRLLRLIDNLTRMKLGHVHVLKGDAASLDLKTHRLIPEEARKTGFDGILLDVPCSNTGVIRRRPDARWRFTEERLESLVTNQKRMLDHLSQFVRPGGRLVYSTCSLEPDENEDLITAWLAEHPEWKLDGELRSFPPESKCDGAYSAKLHREK